MPNVYEVTRSALDEKGFHYKAIEGEPFLLGVITGQNGTFKVLFNAKDDSETLVIYITLGQKAPPPARVKVADYIARVNYGLVIGNFEIDMVDGEVRYKASICVKGGELNKSMVITMLGVSLNSVDKYFSGFMMIYFGQMTAVQAVTMIENGARSVVVPASELKQVPQSAAASSSSAGAAPVQSQIPPASLPGGVPYCQPIQSPPKKPDQ